MLLPHPVKCTACLSVWNDMPTADPSRIQIGMLMVCIHCGHLMVMGDGWILRNLTKPEVEIVKNHPNFSHIQKLQQLVTRFMWG